MLAIPPLNLRHHDATIDSVCSTHTWPLMASVHNFPKTASSSAINVKLPNDQLMAQSHHGTVPIPDMPSSDQQVKIFPDHTYKPLLSLGQLADAGYTFQGDHKHMILNHPVHQSLCATRCPSSGMYLISLTNPHSTPPSIRAPTTYQTTSSPWPQSQISQCIITATLFPQSQLHLLQQSTMVISQHCQDLH